MKKASSPSAQLTLTINDLIPTSGVGGIEIVHHAEFPVASLPEVPPSKRPDGGFVEAVRATGRVVYPLVVINVGGNLHVKDGLRRLQTARLLDLQTVPMIEVKLNAVRGNVLGLMLNAARTANPIAELRMIVELLEQGADESLIAVATHMPVSVIRRRLQLLNLNKELREQVDRGEIRTSAAERLAKMTKADQKKALRHFRKNGSLSHHDIGGIKRATAAKVADALPDALFTAETAGDANLPAWRANVRRLLIEARGLVPAGAEGSDVLSGLEAAISTVSHARAA